MLGNGDGTLQGANNLAVGKNPSFIAVGDFNGDGKVDLLVCSAGASTVSVLLGNGDGTFKPAITSQAAGTIVFVATGDLNVDNRLDLAVVLVPPGGQRLLTIWLGNEDGTFQRGSNVATTSCPDRCGSLTLTGTRG